MNHSFIVRSGSIIGRNMSSLNSKSDISLELSRRDFSVAKEDSFFKTGDPEVDMITEVDVVSAIPLGKF